MEGHIYTQPSGTGPGLIELRIALFVVLDDWQYEPALKRLEGFEQSVDKRGPSRTSDSCDVNEPQVRNRRISAVGHSFQRSHSILAIFLSIRPDGSMHALHSKSKAFKSSFLTEYYSYAVMLWLCSATVGLAIVRHK